MLAPGRVPPGVEQEGPPNALPAGAGDLVVEAPARGQLVECVRDDGILSPRGVGTELATRRGATGKPLLEIVMAALGIVAATVQERQHPLRGHRLQPALVARRRDVGDQHLVGERF